MSLLDSNFEKSRSTFKNFFKENQSQRRLARRQISTAAVSEMEMGMETGMRMVSGTEMEENCFRK